MVPQARSVAAQGGVGAPAQILYGSEIDRGGKGLKAYKVQVPSRIKPKIHVHVACRPDQPHAAAAARAHTLGSTTGALSRREIAHEVCSHHAISEAARRRRLAPAHVTLLHRPDELFKEARTPAPAGPRALRLDVLSGACHRPRA